MKLTNYDRDTIIRAIFGDVPQPDDKIIKEGAQAALVKAMSPECRRLYNKSPQALRVDNFYDIAHRIGFELIVGDADADKALAPWRDAKLKYEDAKYNLRMVIYSCSTLKRLKDLLPEFSSYFPTEDQPTKNLPAVTNLVTDIVKLGWKAKP